MNDLAEFEFRFARDALSVVLGSNIFGKTVLLPAFTCADFVGFFRSLNCQIHFLEVDNNLQMIGTHTDWPKADIFVLTHYMGSKTQPSEVRKYQKLHSCIVIEDNAHAVCNIEECQNTSDHEFHVEIISYRKANQLEFGAKIIVNDLSLIDRVYYKNYHQEEIATANVSIRSWLRKSVNLNYLRALKYYLTGYYTGFKRVKVSFNHSDYQRSCIKQHRGSSRAALNKTLILKNTLKVKSIVKKYSLEMLNEYENPTGQLTFGTIITTQDTKLLRFLMLRYGVNIFPWPEIDSKAAKHLSQKLQNTWIICHL